MKISDSKIEPSTKQSPDLKSSNMDSGLSQNDIEYLTERKQKINQHLESVKETLFNWTQLIVDKNKEAPCSSIIVDDASARFIGLFVWKVLKAEGANNLPIIFYRRDTGHRVQGHDVNLCFESHGDLSQAGTRPLLVSEYTQSGKGVFDLSLELVENNSIPLVAVFSNEQLELNSELESMGISDCIIGTNDSLGYHHFYNQEELNGVAKTFTNRDMHEFDNILISFPSRYCNDKNQLIAQKIVNHARKILHLLVEEFLSSCSSNND